MSRSGLAMQHFDNGHLPEPDEHVVDEFVSQARAVFLVAVETAWIGAFALAFAYVVGF